MLGSLTGEHPHEKSSYTEADVASCATAMDAAAGRVVHLELETGRGEYQSLI